jgi:amino acid transporter
MKNPFLGRPLVTEQLASERLGRAVALGVLAPDCISSSAYGSEQMLNQLIPYVGLAAFSLVVPITGAILGVLFFVTLSYLDVIKLYTQAGGAYVVARENFGPKIAQIADKKFTLKDIATDWHNNWVSLTEGVDAGPLVSAFRDLVGVFDTGAESGKSFRDAIVDGVDTVIKWVAAAVENVGIFAIKFETGFYKAEASMGPMIVDLETLTAKTDVFKIAGGFVEKFSENLFRAAIAIVWVVAKWDEMLGVLGRAGEDGKAIGTSFVDGLVEGIKSGYSVLSKVASGLAHEAVSAVKDTLGIHSPSRVMADMGENVTAGFAEGVQAGGGGREIMADAFAAPRVAAPSGVGSGGGHTFDFSGLKVEIHGVQHAEEILTLLPSALTDAFEQAANEMGA